MKHYLTWTIGFFSVLIGAPTAAHADELAISFDLRSETLSSQAASTDSVPSDSTSTPTSALPISRAAAQVPQTAPAADLPPPPSFPTLSAIAPPDPQSSTAIQPEPDDAPSHPTDAESLVLEFELAALTANLPLPDATASNAIAPYSFDQLFAGETDSLVARAVGSAEGTRSPTGERTRAFYGHVDPGNGVWNLGTFSYQHGARSPEEADAKQLKRLRQQAEVLQAKAAAQGMTLGLEEILNGIDLANQSPRAALDRQGYIDRLAQAYDMGLTGSEAILWARTRSYLNPDTGRWNAPGLGNTLDGISRDQERRQRAIAKAMAAYPRDRLLAADSKAIDALFQ
jgi:hypothetical protein